MSGSFYSDCSLVVPEISQRHIRVRKNGSMIGLPLRFSSYKKLKKVLSRIDPDDVYFTVGRWLNPELFHGRQRYLGWHKLRRLMVGCDFVVDIDVRPGKEGALKTFTQAYEQLVMVSDFLKSQDFREVVYVNSGGGYHAYVRDFWDKIRDEVLAEHYMDRPAIVRKRMIELCKMIRDEKIVFDEGVSCDPYRVVRVWGSRHHSGRLCYSSSVAGLVRASKSLVNANSWDSSFSVMTGSLSKSRARAARTLSGVSGGTEQVVHAFYNDNSVF